MHAVPLSPSAPVWRLVRPAIPAWFPTQWMRRASAPAAPESATATPTPLPERDPAALHDIGVPAPRASAREQAAQLWMRAGHG